MTRLHLVIDHFLLLQSLKLYLYYPLKGLVQAYHPWYFYERQQFWKRTNEDWGAQDIATSPKTRQYIMDMYHFMKIAHPQFLVVDNDGWQHISFEGRLKSDLLTAHLYTTELSKWKKLLDDLVSGEQLGVTHYPLIVGDPFFFRKQVPLIVSEWGGFGFIDYGGPENADEKAKKNTLIQGRTKKKTSCGGCVYTSNKY